MMKIYKKTRNVFLNFNKKIICKINFGKTSKKVLKIASFYHPFK